MTQASGNHEGVLNLRQALRLARQLGLDVRDNAGTGEVRVTLTGTRPVNHNARRKDASRALMHLLRQAETEARLLNTLRCAQSRPGGAPVASHSKA